MLLPSQFCVQKLVFTESWLEVDFPNHPNPELHEGKIAHTPCTHLNRTSPLSPPSKWAGNNWGLDLEFGLIVGAEEKNCWVVTKTKIEWAELDFTDGLSI